MTYFITGSTAIDQLMTFPGKFSDSILPERLEKLSVSFLLDKMAIFYGGVGANIAYGLGVLEQKPYLISAVGKDFAEYNNWLVSHGVNTDFVFISEKANTARFICQTDEVMSQISGFYPGAMSETTSIKLAEMLENKPPEGVIISTNDPEGMVAHTRDAKTQKVPFYADPSQQLPRLSKEQILELLDGAAILFSNDYEWDLMQKKTGLSAQELTDMVGIRVTTLGENGAQVHSKEEEFTIPCVPEKAKIDPTGVGDGFRAGFLAGYSHKLSLRHCVEFGQLIAVLVLENNGPQGWEFDKKSGKERLTQAYGEESADAIYSALFPQLV